MKQPKTPHPKASDVEWLNFIFEADWQDAPNLANKLGNKGITKKRRVRLMAAVATRKENEAQHDRLAPLTRAHNRRVQPFQFQIAKGEAKKNRAARKQAQPKRLPSEKKSSSSPFILQFSLCERFFNAKDAEAIGHPGLAMRINNHFTHRACTSRTSPVAGWPDGKKPM